MDGSAITYATSKDWLDIMKNRSKVRMHELPKEPDELMKFLSDEGSLKEEVDGLLEKHGAKVWGRVGDREHLITANEPGVEEGLYPRDLYIENEEDRAL